MDAVDELAFSEHNFEYVCNNNRTGHLFVICITFVLFSVALRLTYFPIFSKVMADLYAAMKEYREELKKGLISLVNSRIGKNKCQLDQ